MRRHLNIRRLQVIWWPRRDLYFHRRNYVAYAWILYLWPIEFRWFKWWPHEKG